MFVIKCGLVSKNYGKFLKWSKCVVWLEEKC